MKILTYEIVLLKFLCTDINYFKILGTFFLKNTAYQYDIKKKLTNLNNLVITKKKSLSEYLPQRKVCAQIVLLVNL